MERTIVRVDPHQAGRLMGGVYFLIGILSMLPALAVALLGGDQSPLGLGVTLFLPVLYAVVGYLGTVVFCALFNFVAGRMGGVRVELSEGA